MCAHIVFAVPCLWQGGHRQFTSLAFNFTHQTMVVYTAHSRQGETQLDVTRTLSIWPSVEDKWQIMIPWWLSKTQFFFSPVTSQKYFAVKTNRIRNTPWAINIDGLESHHLTFNSHLCNLYSTNFCCHQAQACFWPHKGKPLRLKSSPHKFFI